MHVNPIDLMNKNKLIRNYRNKRDTILQYFDYSPFNDEKKRLTSIHNRTYNRPQLVNVLKEMNENWGASEETLDQIERLKLGDSVVVIGGQQAGLATGPMYTVNKVISIIQLARQKEQELNVPVIPIFWIAGEDHDYDEINHVYITEDETMNKLMTRQQTLIKKSVSHIEIDHDLTNDWLKQLFLSLQETEYTKDLYDDLQSVLKQSKTFVDFFARTIFYLFQNEGLVLFDSAHESARSLESDFFVQIIENQQPFAEAIVSQLEALRQDGHLISVDAVRHDTHLFYHDDRSERVLLQRKGDLWTGKNDEVELTTNELLDIAKNNPERLSNNVISRPLMQEYLFPTLAFVAGDGEISYWATLKKAFHLFEFMMPPVVPRLSFTFINNKAKLFLKERMIPIESAINDGVNIRKLNWLQSQNNPPIPVVVSQVKEEIEKIHQPLQQVAKSVSESVHQTARQNLKIINREIDYLQNKINNEMNRHYHHEIEKYDYIDNVLHPSGVLQERMWNPIPFLNQYSKQFIIHLTEMDCQFEHDHYVVYL